MLYLVYTFTMCGRFFIASPEGIFDYYSIPKGEREEIHANYNVSPGQNTPFVFQDSDGMHLEIARWGLIPFWAKDPRIGYRMINARMETLREKPTFRKPLISQRALIPTSGYFEWRQDGNTKQPFAIKPQNREIASFAALYNIWKNDRGDPIPAYTIITTQADATVKPIHDRMPVILTPNGEKAWVDYENNDPEMLEEILRNENDHSLETFPVSKRVGNSSENDKGLVEKVEI